MISLEIQPCMILVQGILILWLLATSVYVHLVPLQVDLLLGVVSHVQICHSTPSVDLVNVAVLVVCGLGWEILGLVSLE